MKNNNIQVNTFLNQTDLINKQNQNRLFMGFAKHLTYEKYLNNAHQFENYQWILIPRKEDLFFKEDYSIKIDENRNMRQEIWNLDYFLQKIYNGDFETLRTLICNCRTEKDFYKEQIDQLSIVVSMIQGQRKDKVLKSSLVLVNKLWDSFVNLNFRNYLFIKKYRYDSRALCELLYLQEVLLKYLEGATLQESFQTENMQFYNSIRSYKEYSLDEALIIGAEAGDHINHKVNNFLANTQIQLAEEKNQRIKMELAQLGANCIQLAWRI